MAQMIPDFFDSDKTPPGEQDCFNWLAKCPSDWLVFHSLDLQAWNRSRQTEIDFLVVIPETGMLCIEVKSHKSAEVRKGVWYLGGKPSRSPLKQAEDATKTFLRRLRGAHPELANIPIAKLVVFPRAPFSSPAGVEFSPWEIWDMNQCTNFARDGVFGERVENSLTSSIKHSGSIKKLNTPVSKKAIKKLEEFLRPTFKTTPADAANRELRQLKMEQHLREQQKPVLALFKNNERLIVGGPAGTGKSLIALEIARQMRDQKLRTGLLCFNRLMGKKLESETKSDGPLIVAGTVHARLAEMLEIEIPNPPDSNFWNQTFLELAEAALLDDDRKLECQFDVLILDEAQDILCKPRLMDLVECTLKGGFTDGKWLFAGDYRFQVFGSDEARRAMNKKLDSIKGIPRTASFELEENCRNYRVVGVSGIRLAGMEGDVYESYMRGDGNIDLFNPKFYENEGHQSELLEKEIKRHINRGTSIDQIVVLSFQTANKSAASQITGKDIPMKRLGQPGRGVSYGSIHEFKGLEANVVILTDIKQPTNDFEKDLFYVGMTRALFSISVLVAQSDQSWFLNAVSES